jgi:hypothetical protein
MLILVTPSGLENFFLEVGREAIEGHSEPVAPTPQDIQKVIETVPKYGLEVKLPRSGWAYGVPIMPTSRAIAP